MRKNGSGKTLWITILSFMIIWSNIVHFSIAKNSEIEITIKDSSVANLNYIVIKNGKPVEDEVQYKILTENGDVYYEGWTKDAAIWHENLPFGKYSILIHEGKDFVFQIEINKDYIKTQHIVKHLILEEVGSVETGDRNAKKMKTYFKYLVIAVIIIKIMRKRKERKHV